MIDPATWDLALAILTGKGHKELAARRIIGVWLRDYTEADVVDALMAASNKVDPVAYVRGILKTKKTKGRVIQDQLPLVPEAPPADPAHIREVLQRSKAILKGRV